MMLRLWRRRALAAAPTSLFIPPCEPILCHRPPNDEAWLHEIKFDGYRLQIAKLGPKTWLYSRDGHDWTTRLPHLAAALRSLACAQAVIDAEIVAINDKGIADFATLHSLMQQRREDGLVVWAFDLMILDNEDLRTKVYTERKAQLARLVQRSSINSLYYSETFLDGEKLMGECARRGIEGIVSKHKNSPYRSGKSCAWIKVKSAPWLGTNRNRHEKF